MKNVLGLDPGKVTGVCIVKISSCKTYQKPYYSTEVPLDKLTADMIDNVVTSYRVDHVVIEDVVKSGHLSKDKFNQIRAFDRCYQGVRKAGIEPTIISPETRKRGRKAPKGVKSHVKDAFLIATHDCGGDSDATDSTPSEEKET